MKRGSVGDWWIRRVCFIFRAVVVSQARTLSRHNRLPECGTPIDIGLGGSTGEMPYKWARRRRSAFEITVTEDRLIAAAATIGESSHPSQG